MSCRAELYVGNDVPVIVESMHNPEVRPYTPITDAVVTMNLFRDEDDVLIVGPLPLDYDATGDRYEGVIDAATPLVAGTAYRVEIDAAAPGGLDARWVERRVAMERTLE